MKQKNPKNKKKSSIKSNHKNRIADTQQQNDEPIIINKPKHIHTPEFHDHINYITLQQFQGTINDQRTLNCYSNVILKNNHLFVNKIILHLTSGCNCFYSIYAAKAGASKVYCVVSGNNLAEQQNVWMMREIVKENDLQDIIEVKLFKDFNAEVDIIIGQPMGFCMHYDGLLDRMIQARDLYLDKRNGLMFPHKLNFKCALINDEHFFDKKIQFWNHVYGIPMKSMQQSISNQPIVKIVDPSLIISDIKKFIQFDLMTVKYEQIEQVNRQLQLKILQKTQSNGLIIWFQIQFNSEGEIDQLKGSPWENPTKLTHVTLYSSQKIQFQEGEKVKVKISGKKYPHHGVSVMKVSIKDQIQSTYTFS